MFFLIGKNTQIKITTKYVPLFQVSATGQKSTWCN